MRISDWSSDVCSSDLYLVEALLRGPDPLPELQSVLANDEIEVAQAVLERSKVLQDQDLIDVVLRRAEEHRMAIALRNDVSAAVAEALVEKAGPDRSEEHTSELQSLMRISYAVFCLKKKKKTKTTHEPDKDL